MVYDVTNRIGHNFTKKDRANKDMRSGVVDEAACSDCLDKYIGKTCRHLKTRINEHLFDLEKAISKAATVAINVQPTNHAAIQQQDQPKTRMITRSMSRACHKPDCSRKRLQEFQTIPIPKNSIITHYWQITVRYNTTRHRRTRHHQCWHKTIHTEISPNKTLPENRSRLHWRRLPNSSIGSLSLPSPYKGVSTNQKVHSLLECYGAFSSLVHIPSRHTHEITCAEIDQIETTICKVDIRMISNLTSTVKITTSSPLILHRKRINHPTRKLTMTV